MHLEDPWREISRDTIETILKGSNAAELCPVLSILKELIPRLEVHQWKPLWSSLVRLERHQIILVRSHVHEVYKKAYDLDPKDPDFAQALLRGCTDSDRELAVGMQNFLAEKLPTSTSDRLLAYVKDFYAPGSDDYFLPYCSHFLLELTTQNHMFKEPVFAHPLDEIKFEVMDLSTPGSQSMSHRASWMPGSYRPQTLQVK